LLPPGAVLLTSRASIGYVAVAGKELTTNQGFASFICEDGVYNYYLAYWLKANKELLEENATGTTFKEISKSKLREFTIPLAPLPDQHRIVAEIEKQFTRLDAAVAALRRAKANLARYKAAVLKAAVEGRLVAQDPTDEPAGALLGRILAERRAQWEAANPKKRYVEPKGPEVAGLPGLPVGWVWARVEQIAKLIQYGTSDKADAENSGVPVIRMGNIQNGRVSPNNLKYMPNNWTANDLLLEIGDVLFNRTNSAELVGKTAVYKGHPRPATFASYLIRLQTVSAYLPEFLSTLINSVYGREYIASVVSQQVGQANVNGTKLANMPVPFPPSDEQRRIIKKLESTLSTVEATEQVIDANLARADRLRQGVLGKAFRGELV